MTYVRDFLGQYIWAGEYVAYPGKGNRSAEYGMILMRVRSVEDDPEYTGHGKVVCDRLDTDYEGRAYIKKVTITNTNKLVIIPSGNIRNEIVNWFHKIDFTEEESSRIHQWLHGQKKVF